MSFSIQNMTSSTINKSIFLLLTYVLTSCPANAWDIETLIRNAKNHPAPVPIKNYLAHQMADWLAPCVQEAKYELKSAADFFAAIQIYPSVTATKEKYFLTFPTEYCPGFFGGQSSPFWVVKYSPPTEVHILLDSSTVSVKMAKSATNGLRDIYTIYGFGKSENGDIQYYCFDGNVYSHTECR